MVQASGKPVYDAYIVAVAGGPFAGAYPMNQCEPARATPPRTSCTTPPPSADIIKAGRTVPPMSCNEGPRSRFPSWIFFDAALRNLDAWVRKGIAPPRADPILVQGSAPVLDQYGNVQGGLRSSYLNVPVSTWYGTSTGASFCFIAGHEVPFAQSRLDTLYPNPGSTSGPFART